MFFPFPISFGLDLTTCLQDTVDVLNGNSGWTPPPGKVKERVS